MSESRQLTKISNREPSSPSNESSRADSIAVLLNRLALHCPVRTLPAGQDALLMEDTIRDLLPYDPRQIAQACETWRRGPSPFFPTSGQLLAILKSEQETSIARARANRPAYRTPLMIEHQRKPLKPWREILLEHGKALPDK